MPTAKIPLVTPGFTQAGKSKPLLMGYDFTTNTIGGINTPRDGLSYQEEEKYADLNHL